MCCSVAEASAATLREMNPLVRIEALPGGVAEQPDTDFLSGFDVILLPQAPLSMQLAYDKACTEVNVAFFTAYSRGTVAYFFENLHVHEHTPMVGISVGLHPPGLAIPISSQGRRHWDQQKFGILRDACETILLCGSTIHISCHHQAQALESVADQSEISTLFSRETCDMVSVLQDAPSGAPLQKSLSSFTPLESALHHPWNKLSARFTHKLVYALRGECAPACSCLNGLIPANLKNGPEG